MLGGWAATTSAEFNRIIKALLTDITLSLNIYYIILGEDLISSLIPKLPDFKQKKTWYKQVINF